MSFGFGVGDFLAAAQLAWTVYSACQAAPSQFKALSDEVEALHIVLESIKKVVLGAGLDASNVNDLNRVSRGCIAVLTELEALIKKYKSLGIIGRKRDKLRWSQEDIDVLRARLTSNVSLLTAFNSSLMNASQTTIITRLDQVLTDIQEGRMGTSSIAELNAELESQGNQVTRKRISQELGRHALLQHAVNKNRAFIIPKINQAINGKEWQIEVVSATYGSLDVTNRVWQFLRKDYSTPQIFLPSNALFGGIDPMPMRVKAFILVCRMTPPSNGIEQPDSFFQTKRFLEGQPVTFDYDINLPRFIPPATSPHNIIILDASYHTWDVTKIVAEIAATQKAWPLIIQANNAQFGKNTAPGIGKQLSITYAYRSPDGVLDHHVEVVDEDDTITIPLQPSTIHVELTIHAAYWADWDVTQLLRSRVSQNQTLLIDTSAIHSFDPWFNVLKTLSIMYQYTTWSSSAHRL